MPKRSRITFSSLGERLQNPGGFVAYVAFVHGIHRRHHPAVFDARGRYCEIALGDVYRQSFEMSLLVLSLSIAVASREMIAQPRMNNAIGVAERYSRNNEVAISGAGPPAIKDDN